MSNILDSAALAALVDTYLAAWNEPDATTRREHLASAWSADGEYIDPQSHSSGREELNAIIDGFQSGSPGARFSLNGPISHHHNVIRFYWTLRFANGVEVQGMDYGEIAPDDKLTRIVGFF